MVYKTNINKLQIKKKLSYEKYRGQPSGAADLFNDKF